MPPPYPNWNHGITPNTNSRATASSWRYVKNATVIKVSDSTYRNCNFISDTFELANPNSQPQNSHGALRIEALCSWFGVKPPTTHPNIIVIPGKFQIVQGYTGAVVDNIQA